MIPKRKYSIHALSKKLLSVSHWMIILLIKTQSEGIFLKNKGYKNPSYLNHVLADIRPFPRDPDRQGLVVKVSAVQLKELEEQDPEVGVVLLDPVPGVQLQEGHDHQDQAVRGQAAGKYLKLKPLIYARIKIGIMWQKQGWHVKNPPQKTQKTR